METVKSKTTDELRINIDEFDKIMRAALQVHLEEPPKKKITAKTRRKAVRKKSNTK